MNMDLTIEFSPNGKASGTTVTTRLGDQVIHVNRFDVMKAKPREEYIDTICKGRDGISRDEVTRQFLEQAAKLAAIPEPNEPEPPNDEASERLARMPQHVKDSARAMLESPTLMRDVMDDVSTLGVAGERELTATIYKIGTSRLLTTPLSGIVSGPSSGGKSRSVSKVAEMFPPEAVIHATSLTPQALFYMPQGSLCNKWVVAGERSRLENDETAEATRALREMISNGRLTKLIPLKIDGQMVTQTIDQPGPIAYIETTTLGTIFAEDANRCLLLSIDEGPDQTKKVINRLAAAYEGEQSASADAVIQKHHAAQRMLQQRRVLVPFARKIAAIFPRERVEARRAFPHLMGMIQTSALLHQFQRQLTTDGEVIAEPTDYELACRLCAGPLARLLGGTVSGAAARFFQRIREWDVDRFTTAEATKRDKKAAQNVRAWLRELAEAGAVEQVEVGRGSKPSVWRRTDMSARELAAGDCGLPESIE